MNKSELIEALAQDQGLPPKTAASIVNTILDTMIESLVKGENIELRGFGSFTVREYETYTGRNPKTGAQISVKPKKLPFFKVGKELREAIDANRGK
jgi:integration host factor subunit beta